MNLGNRIIISFNSLIMVERTWTIYVLFVGLRTFETVITKNMYNPTSWCNKSKHPEEVYVRGEVANG